MELRDLLTNFLYVLSLEPIVASNPARIITGGSHSPSNCSRKIATAHRMNKESLPRTFIAARFQYELAAPRRNDGVEGKTTLKCAWSVIVTKTNVRSNLTETRRENVLPDTRTHLGDLIARDRRDTSRRRAGVEFFSAKPRGGPARIEFADWPRDCEQSTWDQQGLAKLRSRRRTQFGSK